MSRASTDYQIFTRVIVSVNVKIGLEKVTVIRIGKKYVIVWELEK